MQALVTCSKHFERALPAFEPVNHMREDDNAREIREIKSPLLQRLISAVSSEAICEHANRLLSALNTDAAQAGDKLNLFNCEDGRFSEVSFPSSTGLPTWQRPVETLTLPESTHIDYSKCNSHCLGVFVHEVTLATEHLADACTTAREPFSSITRLLRSMRTCSLWTRSIQHESSSLISYFQRPLQDESLLKLRIVILYLSSS